MDAESHLLSKPLAPPGRAKVANLGVADLVRAVEFAGSWHRYREAVVWGPCAAVWGMGSAIVRPVLCYGSWKVHWAAE